VLAYEFEGLLKQGMVLGIFLKVKETKLDTVYKRPNRILLVAYHHVFDKLGQVRFELVAHRSDAVFYHSAYRLTHFIEFDKFSQNALNKGHQLGE
jgi:hypothetical protein